MMYTSPQAGMAQKKLTLILVALICGVGLGILGTHFLGNSGSPKCTSQYTFINPDPECDVYDERSEKLSLLQDRLESEIADLEKKEGITRIAVFSRDLTSRRFAGVNSDQVFYLASLLKVPLAVAYYKFAEVEPLVLKDKITYDGGINEYPLQKIPPSHKLVVGTTYTIEELISRSIIYSDNTAAQILIRRIPPEFLENVQSSLGMQIEKTEGEKEDLVTARTYANVFRILYNSSYLSRGYSNELLETLTKSEFQQGAPALLPKETIVAHKFGERTLVDQKSGSTLSSQLHDCGIVYGQNDPYTFCILTEGKDYQALTDAIQKISLTIYETLK